MEKETREMRIMINKAGGNAGQNSLNYKMSIPSSWANELGITEDSRNVLVTFDGKKNNNTAPKRLKKNEQGRRNIPTALFSVQSN